MSAQPTPPISGASTPDLSARTVRWLFAAAIGLFFALGLPQVSRPFQGDEVEFIRLGIALFEQGTHRIDRGFIDDVVETGQFQLWNFHPPLYVGALGAVCKIFGPSEIVARGFGLACGAVSLLLVFCLARRVTGPALPRNLVAALATSLCAVNPFFIQGCLLIDIDGTVYTTLFLLLVYLAIRLESADERLRLSVLTAVFALTLAAKMTTIIVFPVVLVVYHVAHRDWRRALGDALAIGTGGSALFIVLYAGYCTAAGLDFKEVFTHTSRSGSGFAPLTLLLRLFAFSLPLPLLWDLFASREETARVSRLHALTFVAAGLSLLYAINLLVPSLGLWIVWYHALTSYFLTIVPFCTPALFVLFYGAIAARARQWTRGHFETIDLPIALSAAVVVTYIGVMTRGAAFSLYQAPVVPLLAVAVAHAVSAVGFSHREGWPTRRAFALIVACSFAYGVFVIGDAFFLTKYRLFDVDNRDLFGAIVRGWAGQHLHDTDTLRALGRYLGYQSAGLAAIWYALTMLPLALAGLATRRWLRPATGLAAATLGLGLALSACQSAADYSTALAYGKKLSPTREMAAFINAHVSIKGHYLSPRGLAYYIHQPGFIDDTRYGGGYRQVTSPEFNACGELVLHVSDSARATDALPATPIHFAVGHYPLLDLSPAYRVIKQIGPLKLYQFVESIGPSERTAGKKSSVPPRAP